MIWLSSVLERETHTHTHTHTQRGQRSKVTAITITFVSLSQTWAWRGSGAWWPGAASGRRGGPTKTSWERRRRWRRRSERPPRNDQRFLIPPLHLAGSRFTFHSCVKCIHWSFFIPWIHLSICFTPDPFLRHIGRCILKVTVWMCFSNVKPLLVSEQDSELFLLGGDGHKKKKKQSDDFYYRGENPWLESSGRSQWWRMSSDRSKRWLE